MKKTLLALTVLTSLSLSAFGQGWISVDNLNGSGDSTASSFGLIYKQTGSGPVAITENVNIEVLGSTASGGTFTSFGSFTPASWVEGMPGVFFGDTLNIGTSTWFKIRAWTGPETTYAAAVTANDYLGTSSAFQTTIKFGNDTPLSLDGMPSFVLTQTPEPSTIALGVMGAATLLFRRRK